MVDFEAFGDLLRNAIKDIEGGGATGIVRQVGEDVSDAFSSLRRDVTQGAKYIARPLNEEATVGDLFGGLRRDISSSLTRDAEGIGSRIRNDLGDFADFVRKHKLGLGLLGAGLAGLGAYELLSNQNGGNSYNNQLGQSTGTGGTGGGSGAGLLGGAGGQCDPTCGQIPTLPPCPQCNQGAGLLGGFGGTGSGSGSGGSIFSNPLVWIIIAIIIVIIVIIVLYHHKKKG